MPIKQSINTLEGWTAAVHRVNSQTLASMGIEPTEDNLNALQEVARNIRECNKPASGTSGSANGLMVFSNPEFGQMRTMEEDGKTLFCGVDVARILGYKDTTSAMKQHCRGVVKRHLVDRRGQIQETNFIPEGDIYRLAARSQLPTAEKFESWVFDEVLPSIRKTGGYNLPQLTTNELVLKMAQANVELERQIGAVQEEVRQISGKFDTALKTFAAPSIDHWRADMDAKIKGIAEAHGKSLLKLRGWIYAELEQVATVDISIRLTRLRGRMKKQGATYKERQAVTMLDVIGKDKQLRAIFEGIVKKYQAMYETQD